MDEVTFLLLLGVGGSFSWWFKLQLDDHKQGLLNIQKEEKDRGIRAERVKSLLNR
jgi:hypothetical protein